MSHITQYDVQCPQGHRRYTQTPRVSDGTTRHCLNPPGIQLPIYRKYNDQHVLTILRGVLNKTQSVRPLTETDKGPAVFKGKKDGEEPLLRDSGEGRPWWRSG